MLKILRRQIIIAPFICHHYKKKQGQQNIHDNACNHYYQSLPGWFCPEFIRLWWLLHLFFIHALIDHPGDFYITSEWNPTNTIYRFTDFLFPYTEPWIEE